MKIETYPVRSKSQDLGEARYPVFDSLAEACEGTEESIGETKCLELLNSQIKTNSMNALRTQSTKGSTKAALHIQAQSEIITEIAADGLHQEAIGDAAAIERLVAAQMDKIAEEQKAEPVAAE